jgi:hypothetical protein
VVDRLIATLDLETNPKTAWENEFKCDGVSTLADFSTLVSELEALDPVSCAVHSGRPW